MSARALFLAYSITLLLALLLQLVRLPEALAAARPMWLALFLGYWALTEPRVSALTGAFLTGLCVDILFGAALGQHALALIIVVYLVTRLRHVFILFPLWQATLVLVPVWLLHAFVLFWIDGLTRHQADPWLRWLPVLSTALFWPLVYTLMELLRGRSEEE